MAKFVPEPFRLKTVEAVQMTSHEERARLLVEAGYDPFISRAVWWSCLEGQKET